jgi:hypothetical protein
MRAKKVVTENAVHWHGLVDPSVYQLAELFLEGRGCAECLATEIQSAIEDHLEDLEDEQ